MATSRETAATTAQISVVLDSSGRVVGASKPSSYRPAKESDERDVTVGMVGGPGQSVAEVEVPADVANLEGGELLARLADQPSVRAVIAATPTAGQASFGSSQIFAAVPSGVSQQGLDRVSAGQGAIGPATQSRGSLMVEPSGAVTAGSLG
jgi:hypothetical protein